MADAKDDDGGEEVDDLDENCGFDGDDDDAVAAVDEATMETRIGGDDGVSERM